MNFFKNISDNKNPVSTPKVNKFFTSRPEKEHTQNKQNTYNTQNTHQNIPLKTKVLIPKNNEIFDLSQNLDILYIDKRIQLNFNERRLELDLLYKKLENLSWLINNGINKIEKITATKLHRNLYDYINDVLYNTSLNLYLLKSCVIIEKYKKTLVTNNSFFSSNTNINKENSLQLKLQFLMIVSEYINLKNFKLPTNFKCIGCGKIATGYNKDSYIVCECGILYEILDDSPNFKDTNRVNMASRYKYSHIGHFKEAMNRFEGKQSTGIDDYIISNIKDEIKLKKLTIDTVTKEEVCEILISLKYSDYYADINLIYFKITNKSPPDITSYRLELLELLEFITEAYEEIFGEIDNSLISIGFCINYYK